MVLLDLHRMNVGPDNVLSKDRNWSGVYPLDQLEADIFKYIPELFDGITKPSAVRNKTKRARGRVYYMFYWREYAPEDGRDRMSNEHPDKWDDRARWETYSREKLKNHPRRVGRIA